MVSVANALSQHCCHPRKKCWHQLGRCLALWFAGYLIAVAGELLQQQTQGLRTAIVVRLGHRRFAALPTFGLGNLHRIVPSSHKQLRHRMPGSGAARMSGSLRAGP